MTTSHEPPAAAPGRSRHDLLLFMALAFVLSWGSWLAAMATGGTAMTAPTVLPYIFGAFGPLIAALVVRIRRARRGEPAPAHAVRFRRASLLWAPLFLVLAAATVLVAALIGHAAGGPALSWEDAKDTMDGMGGPAAFLVSMVISGPLSEEPGWRGTAYPRMRASMNRLQVGLVLGVIWAVWHLPLFFIDGTVQNELGLATPSGVLFAASSVPMAMLIACAYERAGVLAAIAVHFAANTTMVLLGVDAPVVQALIIGIQAIAVAALLATHRPAAVPAARAAAAPAVAEGARR
ncbi:type II CAAX endopeptidase family protein [Spirillospora sp. NPDC029432]|uniref:CPBP family intramembrane glutamic endopeptidase n=1 Tax=Spirillospora sp. NPDC029432 TaxID=3154599 RepID=UPI003454300C